MRSAPHRSVDADTVPGSTAVIDRRTDALGGEAVGFDHDRPVVAPVLLAFWRLRPMSVIGRLTHFIAVPIVLLGILALPTSAGTFLGPADPGAEQGSYPFNSWFTGASGAGFVDTHDPSNPYAGSYDFKVGNTVASTPFTGGNYGDFRSVAFALGDAAHGNQPISFGFAYQLPGAVATGDNLFAELIFWQSYGNNGDGDGYLGEYNVALGSSSGDTSMATYSLFSHDGIVAPAAAEFAAVRFTANIFIPWSSGTAYVDQISVVTYAVGVPEIGIESLGTTLALIGGVLALGERRRRVRA